MRLGKRASFLPSEERIAEELESYRIRSEFEQLTARLRALLAEGPREPWREALSFELCDVLAYHGENQSEACAQIAHHLARYPRTDQRAALQRAKAARGCPGTQGQGQSR